MAKREYKINQIRSQKNKMTKQKAYEEFCKLGFFLNNVLGGENKQEAIDKLISTVDNRAQKTGGRESEGVFTKEFFAPEIKKYLENKPVDVIIEGINSGGKTTIKSDSLGFISCDFLLLSDKEKLAIGNVIGEIKYGQLKFQNFTAGLGQSIGYLHTFNTEEESKYCINYALFIFFNTDFKRNLSKKDKLFIKKMWEEENIFTIVI